MITLLILASLIPSSGVRSYRYPSIRQSGIRRSGIRYRRQIRRPSTGILRPFRLKRANIVQKRRVYLYDTSLRQFYRQPTPTIHTFPDGHIMTITPGR